MTKKMTKKMTKAQQEAFTRERIAMIERRAKWEANFLRDCFRDKLTKDDPLLIALARARGLIQTLAIMARESGPLDCVELQAAHDAWLEGAGCTLRQSAMGDWLVTHKAAAPAPKPAPAAKEPRVSYEWSVEVTAGDDEDADCHFYYSATDALRHARTPAEEGFRHVLVLLRKVRDYEMQEARAVVVDGELPETFDDGPKVPARYRAQLDAARKELNRD